MERCTHMMQRLAITTALLVLAGCASQRPAPRGPGDITQPPQGKGCPEPKIAPPPGEGSGEPPKPDDGEDDGTDPIEPEDCLPDPDPEPDYVDPVFDVRAGVEQTRESPMLVACVETLFVGPLSFEACGDGRGLFLDKIDSEPALTAYRARLRVARAPRGRAWLAAIVQAGMTELRAGPSEAILGSGSASPRQLARGPAAGVAVQIVWPLGAGLDLVGDIHLDAAWIPRAGELALPQPALQPTLGATLGLGF